MDIVSSIEASKAQRLSEVARQKFADGGLDVAREAVSSLLSRIIDSRGGSEWDGTAEADPEYFIDLEVIARWLGDPDEASIAEWRDQRRIKYGC